MRPLRRDIQMIFQDPYSSLNPRHTVGTIVGAPYRLQDVKPEGGVKKAGAGPARAGRAQPRALQPLPARVLRRPAPAHRHRPHARPASRKLIVADEPVSALDVSIQAQVVNLLEDLQNELGPDLRVHRARPVGGAARLRPGRGDVPRQDRRDRRPRRPLRPRPMHPYTDGAAVGRARARTPGAGTERERIRLAGRRAQPDQPAARLPLPHPLLEGAGHLRDRGAAAASQLGGTGGHQVACHFPENAPAA